MNRYKTLLFDADNTLFDFSRAEREALCDTMRAADIDPTEERIATYIEINDRLWKQLERGEIEKNALREERFRQFCEVCGFAADVPLMAQNYVEFLSQKAHLIQGADEVCRRLAEKYRLYIVTNGIKFVQERRFAACAIKDYFEGVFISEEVGFEKPHRGYFDAVAKKIDGFSPETALIIGDSLTSDMKGGCDYGMDTCWYNPRGSANKAQLPITYEIRALEELYPLLLD